MRAISPQGPHGEKIYMSILQTKDLNHKASKNTRHITQDLSRGLATPQRCPTPR
jgi:hypothetical protein